MSQLGDLEAIHNPRSTFSRFLLKLFPPFLLVLDAIPCYPVNVFIYSLPVIHRNHHSVLKPIPTCLSEVTPISPTPAVHG